MATLGGAGIVTLADLAKSMDPQGNIAPVIELLTQQNDILDDIHWEEGNLPTGHRTTLRTSLPTVYFRRFNEGVLSSKSTKAQIEDNCAMMEAYSEVDRELLKLYGNKAEAFRAGEDNAFLEAFNQQLSTTLMYGSLATDEKQFNGFATRFADVNIGESSGGAKDGAVLDLGGVGSDNTSIWLIGYGQGSVAGIYPKGMMAGLETEDLGRFTKTDANGGLYEVLRTHFMWKCGLSVRDWRFVLRGANIDVSNLLAQSSAADLVIAMIKLAERRPKGYQSARWCFYMNRSVRTMLRVEALSKSQYTTTFEDVAGKTVMMFEGIPVRIIDQILNTEAQLT